MSRALYDTYDYPRYWKGRECEDQAERIALQRFFAQIPESQRNSLIDIGGGFGRLASLYAPLFPNCLLVDPSKRLLLQAKKHLKNISNIKFSEGSVRKIPVRSKEFDVALLVRVVHHLPDPSRAFWEAYRVLKPGGFFLLEFANKIHFLACLRAWSQKDFGFTNNLVPFSQSSQKTPQVVPFLNHHPRRIRKLLEKAGFKILDCLSVSNFRHPLLKKLLPLRFLLFLESLCQKPLAFFHFGPSIFLLCRKT